MLLFYYDRNILGIKIIKKYTITYSKILSKGNILRNKINMLVYN